MNIIFVHFIYIYTHVKNIKNEVDAKILGQNYNYYIYTHGSNDISFDNCNEF